MVGLSSVSGLIVVMSLYRLVLGQCFCSTCLQNVSFSICQMTLLFGIALCNPNSKPPIPEKHEPMVII
jgi:uncharacterized membrane protein